jgi:pathogenesis-related protein 1
MKKKIERIKQLIEKHPETVFLAGFGLARDLIGCGAIILTFIMAGYSYDKKVNEAKDMVEATVKEAADTLLQVNHVRGQIEGLIKEIDRIAGKADEALDKAAGAIEEIKAISISPGGVKKAFAPPLSKKLKILPAPVPVPPAKIPGLAIEGDLQLQQINDWRGKLGLPSVQRSKHLVIESMDRATELAEKCTLTHDGRNKKCGENLYLGGRSGDGAVEEWASEREHYNARDGSCRDGQVCGHWTQMTWKDTKEVGCAETKCGDGRVVVVCSFFPAGNMAGKKAY